MRLLLMISFTIANAVVLPPVPDLIAVAEHIPDIFHRNFSAFTFQALMTAVEQLPGAVANVRMPFAESPELLPTVHQIGAMDAEESSERLRYFASLFLLTYLATVLLGTCIMTLGPRCGRRGAKGSSEGWQVRPAIEAVTCDEDGTSSEVDTKSSEDAPAAAADTGIIWNDQADTLSSMRLLRPIREHQIIGAEIESRQVQRRCLVTVVFSGVFCASLAAAVFSLTTGRLSKRFGLDWELYYVLFLLNCLWVEVQAIVAATRAGQMDRTFAATAFLEGTISATWPVIADSYDTLKDVLVGALCIHSDSMVLKVLGITSWVFLAAIHVVFLGWFREVKKKVEGDKYHPEYSSWWIEDRVGVMFLSEDMAARFLTEMLGSYAPVMVCPTALKPGRLEPEDDACCSCLWKMCSRLSNFLRGMMDVFSGIAYKQVTPVKRSLLAIENIFQGLVGIAYMAIEGGSMFVAVLNVAVPILQISLAFLLHKPLRRKAAAWFAKKLKLALENKDLVTEEQMRSEAFEDVGIFTAVAPHLADYEGFTELELDFLHHRLDDAEATELAAALEQLQQLKALRLGVHLDFDEARAVALAEAVRRLPRLEKVRVELDGLSEREGGAAWVHLDEELTSRGLRWVVIDIFEYGCQEWLPIDYAFS